MTVRYLPPSIQDLRALKDELLATGNAMADLFGLGGGHQWRKYTGGQAPREMSEQMLFFAAARLVLTPAELQRITDRMIDIGARFVDEPEPDAPDVTLAPAPP